MLAHIYETQSNIASDDGNSAHIPSSIRFLYTTRLPQPSSAALDPEADLHLDSVLFLSRLTSLFYRHPDPERTLDLYLTGNQTGISADEPFEGYPASQNNSLETNHLLAAMAGEQGVEHFLQQKLSDRKDNQQLEIPVVKTHRRRIRHRDLHAALGPVSERDATVAYVCGPAGMTDEFVEVLGKAEGMDSRRVFCERWW